MPSAPMLLCALLAALATAAPTTTGTLKRDTNAHVASPAGIYTINNHDGGAADRSYHYYSGDGTPSQGWPSQDRWVNFEDMFNNNKNNMFGSCDQYNVAADSGEEVGKMYDAIQQVAQTYGVDHRFILAVIMQESNGCVRVPSSNYGVYNPGLMQDHNGYYTCNDSFQPHHDGSVTNPCPAATIMGMVREGAVGTDDGSGLATLLNEAQSSGATGAQTFYVAARWYNSGDYAVPVGGDLNGGGATESYARDIANRLTGWTG